MNEKKTLEEIASVSLYGVGVNVDTIKYSYKIFSRHFRLGRTLEMGPAEGVMTELLVGHGHDLTIVEGSTKFSADIINLFPTVRVVNSLFEDFVPNSQFDNIIVGHVLEHVNDPVAILGLCRGWLAPNGRVLAAVPNSRSLHRQAAVLMGLLQFEEQLNEMDRHHGHRRVYSPEAFRRDFMRAGFDIDVFGGYWLKPLSNRQIEDNWTSDMLEAFMRLGERYPDIAGEIYIVASVPASL